MSTATAAVNAVRHAPVWFTGFCVSTAIFVVYLATGSYSPNSSSQNFDVISMALPAWRLGQHHDLTLNAFAGWSGWIIPAGDRLVSNRYPGAFVVAAPFYKLFGSPDAPTIIPGVVAACAVTAAAMGILFVLLRRIAKPGEALAGTAILALAGPTWTVSADGLWTHGFNQFWLLIGVLLGVRGKWLSSGLAYGMAVFTRPHTGFVAATQVVWLLFSQRTPAAMRLALGTAAGVVALFVYNHHVFGMWSVLGGYAPEHLRAEGVGPDGLAANIAGALISPGRGVLILTPFVLLLLPGLRTAWTSAPDWVRSAAFGGLVYGLVQLYMIRFTGGSGFFSYRVLIETATLVTPLGVLSYRYGVAHRPKLRVAFWVLVAWSAVTHAFAAIVNWTPGYDLHAWRTYMLASLLGHFGPPVMIAFVVAAAGSIAGAVVIARRTRTIQAAS